MKFHRLKFSRSQLKQVLVIMFAGLVLGTSFVLHKIQQPMTSNFNFHTIKDSLIIKRPLLRSYDFINGWTKLKEQKKWLEAIKLKDSLHQKDIESLKEIDKELNQLINEKN